MRRLVRSHGYLRMRAILGALYVMLGAILIVRTFGAFGLRLTEIPALVLGGALVALGTIRVREYIAGRAGQTP
ncbi:MAG TPA: hypothetical protein VME66_13090 [Candidatus Acidoferrales bacterium]|nr:hypothetical protein [Candidatus Acidoferrales bacterium]